MRHFRRPALLLALALAACAPDARPPVTPQAAEAPPPPPPPRESAPAPAPTVAPVALPRPEGCYVRCIAASGANRVDGELEDRIGEALAGSFDGMRACERDAGRRGSPMMTLRFGSSGQVTFVGVDPAGFEGAESCMEDVAARAAPAITLDGRAVLRCSERCVRPHVGRRR